MGAGTPNVDLPGRLVNPDQTLGRDPRTVNGASHAGDVVLRSQLPDVYDASLRDLVGFAGSL